MHCFFIILPFSIPYKEQNETEMERNTQKERTSEKEKSKWCKKCSCDDKQQQITITTTRLRHSQCSQMYGTSRFQYEDKNYIHNIHKI